MKRNNDISLSESDLFGDICLTEGVVQTKNMPAVITHLNPEVLLNCIGEDLNGTIRTMLYDLLTEIGSTSPEALKQVATVTASTSFRIVPDKTTLQVEIRK